MTAPQTTVRLRRVTLAHAVRTLSGDDLRVMLQLVLGACPSTGRTWTSVARLAEDNELLPERADLALRRLVEGSFVSLWTRRGELRCYEFGALVLRTEVTPANLPVEPVP